MKNIIIEAFKAERAAFTAQITDKCSSANKLTPAEFLKAVMDALVGDEGCKRFETHLEANKDETYDEPRFIALGLLIDEMASEIALANFSSAKFGDAMEVERQARKELYNIMR